MKCPKCGRSGEYVQTCCGVNLETGQPLIEERVDKTSYSEATKTTLKELSRKEETKLLVEEILHNFEHNDTVMWKIRRLVE